jgi:hypothetical protein
MKSVRARRTVCVDFVVLEGNTRSVRGQDSRWFDAQRTICLLSSRVAVRTGRGVVL